ncbi:MAG: hypothetical protein KDA80_02795 [Planctomycetaceae bacterium]|nr:hypothetical protein [Planctomycetaceae bacterium]
MDFQDRLKRAIERGEKTRDAQGRQAREAELTLEELKSLHSGFRIDLTDHIDQCLHGLVDQLPGFRFQSLVGEDGWGGRVTRDDLQLQPGRSAESLYSRLELLVTPFSSNASILELTVKGTVRNREVLNRKHYQKLDDFDLDSFKELVDLRVLEFAEKYSATT